MRAVEALAPSVGVGLACEALALPRSSFYHALQPPVAPSAEVRVKAPPPRTLQVAEKAQVLDLLNSERFQDCAPREVYASLLDEGRYLCSWSTMYRILDENQEVRERRNQLTHPAAAKPQLVATAPNQLWSWDITKLRGPSPRIFYHLYVILDVFSRYVPGWLIAECESAELAQQLIRQTYSKQGIREGQLTLHADRGGPMIADSLAGLLAKLGVEPTHARPQVPDDNPYSEAQFKTLKYRPDYPERFGSPTDARGWAHGFFNWYNYDHYHTALGLLTPAIVHYGLASAVLAERQQTLAAAYAAHPERFVKGLPQAGRLPEAVWINRPQPVLELAAAPDVGAQGRTTPGALLSSALASSSHPG